MIKLADITYYTHTEYKHPLQVLQRHKESLIYIEEIKKLLLVQVIKHLDYENVEEINGVRFAFFRSVNRFFHIPVKTHQYIKAQQPDVVLVQGFVFPMQVIALRLTLGKKVKIIIQHHGERPLRGVKKIVQKIACGYSDAFLFTAIGNADNYFKRGLIKDKDKCFEVLEASTWFKKLDKQECRMELGMTGEHNFLWVGRLDENKDPLIALKGFEKYVVNNPAAKLYMIYQEEQLLPRIKGLIAASEALQKAVIFVGKVEHNQLNKWYSAADFYLSASHKEGSGYALLEAMACGCMPVVTDIPSYRKITDDGRLGVLYEKGNSIALLDALLKANQVDRAKLSEEIIAWFNRKLTFKAIAEDIYRVCQTLTGKE